MAFDKSDLHAAAAGLLDGRVQPEIVKNPELAREICAGLRKGDLARDGTITMAQQSSLHSASVRWKAKKAPPSFWKSSRSGRSRTVPHRRTLWCVLH